MRPLPSAYVLALLFLSAFLSASSGTPAGTPSDPSLTQRLPKGVQVEAEGVLLRPESERFLDFFVIGLDPYTDHFYMLPPLKKNPGIPAADYRELQRELYWLNFELSHGAMMRRLPPNARVFVGVPQGSGKPSVERGYFIDYLKSHCYWSNADVKRRLFFFNTTTPLVWMQDAGEILGRDAKGRALIRIDSKGREEYRGNIQSLVNAYPQYFQLSVTSANVHAEGGDEELVWLPDGGLAMLVGRNRVIEYVAGTRGEEYRDAPVSPQLLEEIRAEFSKTFYGLPIHFVPEMALLDPSKGDSELFHLDMVVTVLKNDKGAHAFVPSFTKDPADANIAEPLDAAKVKRWQGEYDLVAKQMKDLGYKVLRLPMSDHPARSPTNVIKYFDTHNSAYSVYLGRYPAHLPLEELTPQKKLRNALWQFEDETAAWVQRPGPDTWEKMRDRLARVWQQMEQASQEPNPGYEAQAQVYREQGYAVIPVPVYPGGSGGLHCMVLQ